METLWWIVKIDSNHTVIWSEEVWRALSYEWEEKGKRKVLAVMDDKQCDEYINKLKSKQHGRINKSNPYNGW